MSLDAIPIDLLNPGQVFACLGLMEMTEILSGPCLARFAYAAAETQCHFEIDAQEACIRRAIQFLAKCKTFAVAPPPKTGVESLSANKWKVDTVQASGPFFPGDRPTAPATLPARLSFGGADIPIEYWLDDFRMGRDNVKF